MVNYDLADIFNRIVIGAISYDTAVVLRTTVLSSKIVKLLYRQGLIHSFYIKKNELIVKLKYKNNKGLIKKVKFISTPGRKVYSNLYNLLNFYNRNSLSNILIISTPLGLLTSTECLLLKFTSGEILCKIELF